MRRFLILALCFAVPASAAETIAYMLRLSHRAVAPPAPVTTGLTTSYTIDKANHRTNKPPLCSPDPPP